MKARSMPGEVTRERERRYFERLGQHFADFLLCEGTCTLDGLFTFAALFLLAPAGAGTDGAAQNFGTPPAVDGAFVVVKAEDGVGVSEGPSLGGLGEAGDYIE
jgi:hypothetical protein